MRIIPPKVIQDDKREIEKARGTLEYALNAIQNQDHDCSEGGLDDGCQACITIGFMQSDLSKIYKFIDRNYGTTNTVCNACEAHQDHGIKACEGHAVSVL